MSLIKRLWLALACITLAAFLTAASINLLTAQRYLENELRIKNHDAATALALTISQSASDDVMAGLLVSSQFDLGHYLRIEFLAADGKVALQRERVSRPSSVPDWFMRLVPIQPDPGVAMIQSGWKQLGAIRLQSDPTFAYDSLWTSVRALSGLFLVGSIALGIFGTWFIRSIMRPLNRVVEQAQALALRRYIEIKPPSTLEFRRIIESLNDYTRKTKNLLDAEVARLDRLKSEYERDPLTGFMVREVFLRQVRAKLQRESEHEHGTLMIVRLENLLELNHTMGRLQVDGLIQKVVNALLPALVQLHEPVFGRLGARDIGILLPGYTETAALELLCKAAILQDAGLSVLDVNYGLAIYSHGMSQADLLYACDQILAGARHNDIVPAIAMRGAEEWGRIIDRAFAAKEWRLALYPVHGRDQRLLFDDGFARIESSVAGKHLAAGAFLPWARRRGMAGEVDLEMIRLGLWQAGQHHAPICINLGYQAVCDENIVPRVIELFRSSPERAKRLLLDIPEQVAFAHFAAFESFCHRILPLGPRIGIEHLDHQVAHVSRLHGLGIHHLKISRTLTYALENDIQAQGILRSLSTVSHTLGLQVIAEGVDDAAKLPLLFAIGVDGVSGPALS